MKIKIYCDGACAGNPGRGGYCAILTSEKYPPKVTSGASDGITTNNRMEMQAAIAGLSALKYPCEVKLLSDSKYLVNTMSKGWQRNTNLDLWQKLDRLAAIHRITWVWTRRNSLPLLKKCDRIAKGHSKASHVVA
jgi:ribonuclease HI